MNTKELARFEEKYIPVPESGCWVWDGAYQGLNKYGCLVVNGANKAAHRLSYEHYVGPIPEGYHVLHKCDVPSCVNPTHLFIGTHADNMEDKQRKGRAIKGSGAACAKFKEEDISELFYLYSIGYKIVEIAKMYSVDHKTVRNSINGNKWKHVSKEFPWVGLV